MLLSKALYKTVCWLAHYLGIDDELFQVMSERNTK